MIKKLIYKWFFFGSFIFIIIGVIFLKCYIISDKIIRLKFKGLGDFVHYSIIIAYYIFILSVIFGVVVFVIKKIKARN